MCRLTIPLLGRGVPQGILARSRTFPMTADFKVHSSPLRDFRSCGHFPAHLVLVSGCQDLRWEVGNGSTILPWAASFTALLRNWGEWREADCSALGPALFFWCPPWGRCPIDGRLTKCVNTLGSWSVCSVSSRLSSLVCRGLLRTISFPLLFNLYLIRRPQFSCCQGVLHGNGFLLRYQQDGCCQPSITVSPGPTETTISLPSQLEGGTGCPSATLSLLCVEPQGWTASPLPGQCPRWWMALRMGHLICRTQCKTTELLSIPTQPEQGIKPSGTLLSAGPGWLHSSHAHKAGPECQAPILTDPSLQRDSLSASLDLVGAGSCRRAPLSLNDLTPSTWGLSPNHCPPFPLQSSHRG